MKSGGHCMVFAKTNRKVLEFDLKAIVLMQMRFDGKLGFAGGLIEDEDLNTADGVNRELHEEMGLDPQKYPLTEDNFIATHSAPAGSDLDKLHFYALQVPEHALLEIEKNAHTAYHFGEEVLGWVRVPLYTMENGYSGLPAFLDNNFAGNSREQLLLALEKTGVMTHEEIQAAISASKMAHKI